MTCHGTLAQIWRERQFRCPVPSLHTLNPSRWYASRWLGFIIYSPFSRRFMLQIPMNAFQQTTQHAQQTTASTRCERHSCVTLPSQNNSRRELPWLRLGTCSCHCTHLLKSLYGRYRIPARIPTHTSTERETMEYQSISNRVQFVESTQQFLSTQPRLHFPFIP